MVEAPECEPTDVRPHIQDHLPNHWEIVTDVRLPVPAERAQTQPGTWASKWAPKQSGLPPAEFSARWSKRIALCYSILPGICKHCVQTLCAGGGGGGRGEQNTHSRLS